MPTYEYRCRACDHTFEIVQRMSDDTLTICPECGGELRKVFAPPVITFKGSGFYATDHGKKTKTSGEAPSEKKDDTTAKEPAEKPAEKERSSDTVKPAENASSGSSSKDAT